MQTDDESMRYAESWGQDQGLARSPLPGDGEERSGIEIDGEAASTVLEEAEEDSTPVGPIADQQDTVIVLSLETRQVEVEPGDSVSIPVTILNNGPIEAVFRMHMEGWVDEDWLVEKALHAVVRPGERTTVRLIVAPPRVPASAAGDYPLAVVVRAREYPGRQARAGLVVAVLPFDELGLEVRRVPGATLSWFRRSATVPLTVSNLGNRSVVVRLQGTDPAQLFDINFLSSSPSGGASFSVPPGKKTRALARVTARQLPLAGLAGRTHVVQFGAGVAGRPEVQRWVRTNLDLRPLFGPLQMVSATGITLIGIFGMLLLILGAVLGTQLYRPQMVGQPARSAPPPVIVVNLNQPPPTAPPPDRQVAAGLGGGAEIAQLDPSVPLVLPDQVTAPGSGGPFQRSFAQPAAPPSRQAAAPATDRAELTYAQMFQEIGQRYDLDWRMLAAQAYVESGFDTMALSNAGAMGLMQVLPDTWREFALNVEASDPFDAYSNVLVAAVYLDYLRALFAAQGYPDKEWMLVAYSWGPDKLNDFLAAGGTWESMPEQRRQYATEILRIAGTLP